MIFYALRILRTPHRAHRTRRAPGCMALSMRSGGVRPSGLELYYSTFRPEASSLFYYFADFIQVCEARNLGRITVYAQPFNASGLVFLDLLSSHTPKH
eukprot:5217522-Prymnesium_polylepis.1